VVADGTAAAAPHGASSDAGGSAAQEERLANELPKLDEGQMAAIDHAGLQEALRKAERGYEGVDLRHEAAALQVYLAALASN